MATLVEGGPRALFSIAMTPKCRGGHVFIAWIASLYPYLIILSFRQGNIKYRFFFSLWYGATWD